MTSPRASGSDPAFRSWVGIALLVATAIIAVIAFREESIGRTEAAAADAAAAKSDWADAVGHARGAAEAVVPGSPWPERGLRRLDAIGHDAEARGDLETALLAYGAMRTASLATRPLWAGAGDWRTRAEKGLARSAASRTDITGPRVTAQSMLDALERSESPPDSALVALSILTVAAVAGIAWVSTFLGARGSRTDL